MRKIILTSLLILLTSNTFAYDTSRTQQNWDGSISTTYSDGTSSTTRRDWDNSVTTSFPDGSSATSRRDWDGSISTTYN